MGLARRQARGDPYDRAGQHVSDCPAPPAPDPRDRKIARLEERVADLLRARNTLARDVRRLTRQRDELALQLEFVP